MLLIALIPIGIRAVRGISGQREAVVTVSEDGKVIYEGPLGTDHVVETANGGNRIVIRNGEAFMEYADCPDQLCMKEGKVRPWKPLVCLPNHIVVSVTDSDGEPDYDAISK